MKSNDQLQRSDIVGKTIKQIYESQWDIDSADGYGSCFTYIEMLDGTIFELQYDKDRIHGISVSDLTKVGAVPCTDDTLRQCLGKSITEILISEYWPGIGVLLDNQRLIYQRDFANPDRSGALLIGGYSDLLGQTYSLEDVTSFWNQTPNEFSNEDRERETNC